jgi:hypothetical protein
MTVGFFNIIYNIYNIYIKVAVDGIKSKQQMEKQRGGDETIE